MSNWSIHNTYTLFVYINKHTLYTQYVVIKASWLFNGISQMYIELEYRNVPMRFRKVYLWPSHRRLLCIQIYAFTWGAMQSNIAYIYLYIYMLILNIHNANSHIQIQLILISINDNSIGSIRGSLKDAM